MIIAEQQLFGSLLAAHLEAAAPGVLIQMPPAEAVDEVDNLPLHTVLLLLLNGEHTPEEAARSVEILHARFAGFPLCVILDRVDEYGLHCVLRSGAQGVVSTRSRIESLLPILQLLATGETFVPLAGMASGQPVARSPHTPPAQPHTSAPAARLTPKECEVAEVLLLGKSNKEIARVLSMRENTVKIHIRNLLKKLGARTRAEAIAVAYAKLPAPGRPGWPPSSVGGDHDRAHDGALLEAERA